MAFELDHGTHRPAVAGEAIGPRTSPRWPELDRLAAVVAPVLAVPTVVISILERGVPVSRGAHGLPVRWQVEPGPFGVLPFCRQVATSRRPILIQDTARGHAS